MTSPSSLLAVGLRRVLIALMAVALMLGITPSTANAAVQENIKIPLAGLEFDICGETLVHTSGNLHIKFTYTENDNRISGSAHFQPQGAKLVGTVSGNEYVGTGITRDNFSEPVGDNGATTFTFVNNFRIIGKGDAPNFLEHGVTHITLNADGELTADVHLESAECK